ncbi:threonine/serine ThrE exporter family protein [Aridibaculum aurantiacum]|uniref:threonine/serine ThrE exporter family protein n=1 Tax=Aridibaculum aurantiacum TaxID=2810307 RepID=UPI001A9588A0|nr:threonine/serine exporter family protein [Aridibaculum aurantiacum]
MKKEKERGIVHKLGPLLLEVGALLMSAGANTERVRITISRIANAYYINCDVMITFRAITLTLTNGDQDKIFSSVKRTTPHGVNFKVVSAISKMSWQVVEEDWTIEHIQEELQRIQNKSHYPAWITVLVVGSAGAAFCSIAGGGVTDMVIVFLATCIGLLTRRKAMAMNFNPYLCFYFAALAASLVTGIFLKTGIVANKEYAFVTAILFLVPGVPLINSFSDVIDGNLQNAIIRGFHGLIISFTIALGLLTAMFLYH